MFPQKCNRFTSNLKLHIILTLFFLSVSFVESYVYDQNSYNSIDDCRDSSCFKDFHGECDFYFGTFVCGLSTLDLDATYDSEKDCECHGCLAVHYFCYNNKENNNYECIDELPTDP